MGKFHVPSSKLRPYLFFLDNFWTKNGRLPYHHEIPEHMSFVWKQDYAPGRELEFRVRDYVESLGQTVTYNVSDDMQGIDFRADGIPYQVTCAADPSRKILREGVTLIDFKRYPGGPLQENEKRWIRSVVLGETFEEEEEGNIWPWQPKYRKRPQAGECKVYDVSDLPDDNPAKGEYYRMKWEEIENLPSDEARKVILELAEKYTDDEVAELLGVNVYLFKRTRYKHGVMKDKWGNVYDKKKGEVPPATKAAKKRKQKKAEAPAPAPAPVPAQVPATNQFTPSPGQAPMPTYYAVMEPPKAEPAFQVNLNGSYNANVILKKLEALQNFLLVADAETAKFAINLTIALEDEEGESDDDSQATT